MPVLGRALRKAVTIVATEKPFRFRTGVPTIAGASVGPESSMRAVAVYAATRLIAQTIMSLPVQFILRGDKSRERQRPAAVRAFWEDPNPDQSLSSFYESIVLSLLLWGNIYGFPRRNGAGDVIEVWPIDPERIMDIQRIVEPDLRLGLRFRIAGYQDEQHPNGWVENRPGKPPEMLHIPLMTLPGRIKGLSPIAQAAEQIGMTLSSQEHAARFLGDGVHMSGTIETPEPLEKEDAEDLWEGFQKVHAGPSKAGRVGILTGGAKFNTITIPPAELQFLEQMKYGDRKIATLYGVPPHMVGDVERSTSWGTGIEEQTQGFVQYTLLPIIKKVEQGVESAFLRGTDLQMRFEVKGLLRGSVKDRIELHKALYSMGAASANTILASEDMPPIAGDEGDRRYVPLNLRPADQVIPLKDRVDAAGALVRAGFDPADALGAVGLEAMQHSGAPPVTVQVSPSPADDEEGA